MNDYNFTSKYEIYLRKNIYNMSLRTTCYEKLILFMVYGSHFAYDPIVVKK